MGGRVKKSDILGRLVEGVRGKRPRGRRGGSGGGGGRGPAEGGSRRGVWEKGSWGTKNEQNKQPKAPHTLTHTNTTKCWLKKCPPKLEKLAQVELGLRSTGPSTIGPSTIGLSGNWFQYDWPFSNKAAHARPHVLADERNATRNACTAEENNFTRALCFLKNATHSRVVLHARSADVRVLGTPSSRATWSSDTTAARIAASTT